MEIIIVLVIVAVVGLAANRYMKGRGQTRSNEIVDADLHEQAKEESEPKSNNMKSNTMEERNGTRDLFLETLTQIGCQYEIDEGEDTYISFAYQGEYFLVNASNQGRFIQIYDTHWGHVEFYDIDEFTRLKKAINQSNMQNNVTTVYTINEEGKTVDVHGKSLSLFIPEIPEIADYLRHELGQFFKAHETINVEMAKQRALEAEK